MSDAMTGLDGFVYNPVFVRDDDAVIGTFCARHEQLRELLDALNDAAMAPNRHIAIIGPRGFGKTTLVRRLVAEIAQTNDLRDRFYAVVLGENIHFEVNSLIQLWMLICRRLIEPGEIEYTYADTIRILEASYARIVGQIDSFAGFDKIRPKVTANLVDAIGRFAKSIDRQLLIVVENFSDLISDGSLSSVELGALSRALESHPRLIIVATATNSLEPDLMGDATSDNPFFATFRPIELHDLSDGDCKELWKTNAGSELSDDRVQAVRLLTGSNLRHLKVLASFAKNRQSFRQLIDDLLRLADEYTGYFEAKLSSMDKQQRLVFLALAKRWMPATAVEVFREARFGVPNIALTEDILARLQHMGEITVREVAGNKQIYAVRDRIFQLWYMLRLNVNTAAVQSALEFMFALFPANQLAERAYQISTEVGIPDEIQSEARTSGQIELRVTDRHDLQTLDRLINKLPQVFKAQVVKQLPAVTTELLDRLGYTAARDALTAKLQNADQSPHWNVAERTFRELWQDESVIPRLRGWAAWELGQLLEEHESYREADEAYRNAIAVFEGSGELDYLQDTYARRGALLYCHLDRPDDAEEFLKKAIDHDERDPWTWSVLGRLYRDRYRDEQRVQDFLAAEEAFEQAHDLEPECLDHLIDRGLLIAHERERLNQAADLFETAKAGTAHERSTKRLQILDFALRLQSDETVGELSRFATSLLARFPNDAYFINRIYRWVYTSHRTDPTLYREAVTWLGHVDSTVCSAPEIQFQAAQLCLACDATQDAMSRVAEFITNASFVTANKHRTTTLLGRLYAVRECELHVLELLQEESVQQQLPELHIAIQIDKGTLCNETGFSLVTDFAERIYGLIVEERRTRSGA